MNSWTCIFVITFLAVCCVDDADSNKLIYRTKRFGRALKIPDADKRTTDFIESNGYVTEKHEITTEDGYILAIHRVPSSKAGAKPIYLPKQRAKEPNGAKPVVILLHGISGSSDSWLLVGSKALPFLLADRGYDVWLMNSRGSSYSLRHVNMSNTDPEYWNFSFHEQGYYGVAALIDYATSVTGVSKVFLIGHSRGTTESFALLSARPEYNNKVRLMVALAPVVYSQGSRGFYKVLSNIEPTDISRFTRSMNFYALPGLSKKMVEFRRQLCNNNPLLKFFCIRSILFFSGFNPQLFKEESFDTIISHFPDGGGAKEYIHYFQIANKDNFEMFDYYQDNQRIYNSSKPPEYPLGKLSAPVGLFWAENDYLTSRRDVYKFAQKIVNVAGIFKINDKVFNHVDFMWSKKAPSLVYMPVIKLMSRY